MDVSTITSLLRVFQWSCTPAASHATKASRCTKELLIPSGHLMVSTLTSRRILSARISGLPLTTGLLCEKAKAQWLGSGRKHRSETTAILFCVQISKTQRSDLYGILWSYPQLYEYLFHWKRYFSYRGGVCRIQLGKWLSLPIPRPDQKWVHQLQGDLWRRPATELELQSKYGIMCIKGIPKAETYV